MTATDELRRMLDARGVEWDADDEVMDDGSLSQVTYWHCNGIEWSADGRDEYLAFDAVQLLTPEQAIAATLGPRTCKDLGGDPDEFGEWYFVCSECKCEFGYNDFACEFADGNDIGSPHYCPNCGAKVVDE